VKQLDRKIIYLLIIISLSYPLISGFSLPPAKMKTALEAFTIVENLPKKDSQIVLVSFDWGPSTSAENRPQTATAIEHLMRREIPFATISTYAHSVPFLDSVPEKVAEILNKEAGEKRYFYGKSWVNLGFQPNTAVMIQGLARSNDLVATLKTDAKGNPLSEIECMRGVKTIKDIPLLVQTTGLVGAFNNWIQFLHKEDYHPEMIHGCTSITIPEAYIYYVSGQIKGLYEGVAGAAYYDTLLTERYKNRTPTDAARVNTSLASAHLVILFLIILGNISYFIKRRRER